MHIMTFSKELHYVSEYYLGQAKLSKPLINHSYEKIAVLMQIYMYLYVETCFQIGKNPICNAFPDYIATAK